MGLCLNHRCLCIFVLFWKTCAISFQWLMDMLWTRCHHQKQSSKNNEQIALIMLWTYNCNVLFCLHFVLTYIHLLTWLSALCMPVQHSRGPPGEQTHTGGYEAIPPSPLPPSSHSHSVCLLPLPICPAVCLMTWTLIRLEALQCPAPGASTSFFHKVSRAVSHMG